MAKRQERLYAKYPHMEPTGPRTVTRSVTNTEAKQLAERYKMTEKRAKDMFVMSEHWGTPWFENGDPYANTTQ